MRNFFWPNTEWKKVGLVRHTAIRMTKWSMSSMDTCVCNVRARFLMCGQGIVSLSKAESSIRLAQSKPLTLLTYLHHDGMTICNGIHIWCQFWCQLALLTFAAPCRSVQRTKVKTPVKSMVLCKLA